MENGGDIILDNMRELVKEIRISQATKGCGLTFSEIFDLCYNNDFFSDVISEFDEQNGGLTPAIKSKLGKILSKYNERTFDYPLEGSWGFIITGKGVYRKYLVNEIKI